MKMARLSPPFDYGMPVGVLGRRKQEGPERRPLQKRTKSLGH